MNACFQPSGGYGVFLGTGYGDGLNIVPDLRFPSTRCLKSMARNMARRRRRVRKS